MIKSDNEELMVALRKGDQVLLTRWYDQEKKLFMAMCNKVGLKQQDLILDIYQEAISALYIRVKEGKLIQLKAPLRSYLLSIGKNMVIDLLKKQKKDYSITTDFSTLELSIDYDVHELDIERISKMKNAFEQLGSKCKEVIALFYYEGLSISEIKNFMGYKDEQTVKSQKSRCMKTLRNNIETHG